MNDWFELSPERNPARWQALVERINERARPMLEARRRETVAGTLTGWRRPVFTAAAGLAAAAAAVLLLLPASSADGLADAGADEVTLVEAMIPWSVAAWMDGSYAPTAPELVAAVEEYIP